jgi:hypothetical protein
MIIKERDERKAADRFEQAGEQAERQLAFYLARQFGPNEPSVFVLHDLRIPAQGVSGIDNDAVQVDHLLVHKHGLIIIESKSVTTKVRVNEHGEWQRLWDGAWRGMPSPIAQARRQGEALRALLHASREGLRERKALGLVQGGFRHCPIEIIVAISDGGIVESQGPTRPPEVVKADAAAEEARRIIDRHRAGGSMIGVITGRAEPGQGDYVLTPTEMQRVCGFLVSRHQPVVVAPRRSEPTVPAADRADASPPQNAEPRPGSAVCRHCGATSVRGGEARWGNKAYYTICARCGKGTDLDTTCAGCGARAIIRKVGPCYWRECAAAGCGRRDLAFQSQT